MVIVTRQININVFNYFAENGFLKPQETPFYAPAVPEGFESVHVLLYLLAYLSTVHICVNRVLG